MDGHGRGGGRFGLGGADQRCDLIVGYENDPSELASLAEPDEAEKPGGFSRVIPGAGQAEEGIAALSGETVEFGADRRCGRLRHLVRGRWKRRLEW